MNMWTSCSLPACLGSEISVRCTTGRLIEQSGSRNDVRTPTTQANMAKVINVHYWCLAYWTHLDQTLTTWPPLAKQTVSLAKQGRYDLHQTFVWKLAVVQDHDSLLQCD